MWEIYELNLSSNHFVESVSPLTSSIETRMLDLHSNNLRGSFPAFSSNYNYLNCSNNSFTSIDPDGGNLTSSLYFLSFSRNELTGSIPTAICNAKQLQLLNLEHNFLDGSIPDCLTSMNGLSILNLRGNRFSGEIPAKFGKGCSLRTLDLNTNLLQGRIPQSLDYCKELLVLDLGSNRLNDTFPCHLKSLSKMQVLILRSNTFHGSIGCLGNHSTWPLLQIVDLASNHFSGAVAKLFHNWTSIISGTTKLQSEPSYLLSFIPAMVEGYRNPLTITLKGNTYEMEYILKTLTSIDFSNNFLHGEIPRELGTLNALKELNLSHNSFSGNIPASIGNLTQVESLDLSCNAFSGKIPVQVTNLYSLELSFNKLSGEIPRSTQLDTFTASSYQGNQGLYGSPLTPITHDQQSTIIPQDSNWNSKCEREWMLRGAEVGFPVGITIFLAPILYIKRYRDWYCYHLYRLVMKILRKQGSPNSGRMRQRQRR